MSQIERVTKYTEEALRKVLSEVTQEIKLNEIEHVTNYTEVLVRHLGKRYNFDSAEALVYLRTEQSVTEAAASEAEALEYLHSAEVSKEKGRGRPEKKVKKVVNKGEMVEDKIQEILAAEVAAGNVAAVAEKPKKKVAAKKVQPVVETVAVVEPVAEAVTEVVAPKKKVAAKKVKADAPVVEAAVETVAVVEVVAPKKKVAAKKVQPVVEAAAEPVAEVVAPKKKVAAKKVQPVVEPVAEVVAEVVTEVAAPKKKVAAKKVQAVVEAVVEVAAPQKKKAAPKKTQAVVVEPPKAQTPEPVSGELSEEELTEEDEDDVVPEDWTAADGTKYHLIREKNNLLLDYEEHTIVGRLVDGEIVEADEE